MRPVMFVLCFTLGVGLMIYSGYVPKSASARDNGAAIQRPASDHRPQRAADSEYRITRAPTRRSTWYPRTDRATDDQATVDPAAWEATLADSDTPLDDNVEPGDSSAGPHAEGPYTDADEPYAAAGDADAAEARKNMEAALAGLDEDPYDADLDDSNLSDDPNLPAEQSAATLAVEAGNDAVVWTGWDEFKLNGSVTGQPQTYAWKQISGPVQLTIDAPDKPATTATGLPLSLDMSWEPQLYEFELTVTDTAGRQATDVVAYVTLPAPELQMLPRAERFFDYRDGYVLGHYEAWITNTQTGQSTFRIQSPTRLTFTKVVGPEYDMYAPAADQSKAPYIYEITVFHDSEEYDSSWLEFLVDTDEKVPGILQLGVSWVAD